MSIDKIKHTDTLISPADDFLALLSVFSVKTFPFPLRRAACYRQSFAV